jgi:lipid II isoglutaminyl synthase (glutamine-hydrolysing)
LTLVPVPLRGRLAAQAGSVVASLSRRLGRGEGTVIGGRVSMLVDPNALSHLIDGRWTALVSGTNGKTTTTRLLRAALATGGGVVSNIGGANMPAGLVAALARDDTSPRAALEVDEAWLPKVVDAVHPATIALLNLSRDQLDRNNEVRMVASRWRTTVTAHPDVHVVANADDPLVVWAAEPATAVTWVAAGQPWTADASGCPRCHGRIVFAEDGWSCGSCEFGRPVPSLAAGDFDFTLRLPGRANRANAVMAVAVAQTAGIDPSVAVRAMASLDEVDGRYRIADIRGVKARLLLAKNPAGWHEVFSLLAPAPQPVVVAINARIADGRDPSWLWDVPFERLRGRKVVATGERALDLGVRLQYGEVDHVVEPDLVAAVAEAGSQVVDVVANYTTFQSYASRF